MKYSVIHSSTSVKITPSKSFVRSVMLSVLLFLLLTFNQFAQAQITNKGKEFWVAGVEQKFRSNGDFWNAMRVYILAEDTAQVTYAIPGTKRDITVYPGQTKTIEFINTLIQRQEGKGNKTIHITSDQDISVFALNHGEDRLPTIFGNHKEATLVQPNHVLGSNYLIMTYLGSDYESGPSNMIIVGTQDGTAVEIVPSVNTQGGLIAGDTTIITLNTGETYYLKSDNDLSGTSIRSVANDNGMCHNLAVYAGNFWTTIDNNIRSCPIISGSLYEQMFPISTWGKEYLYQPFHAETDVRGDLVRVMAAYDHTKIQVTGEAEIELQKGQYYTFERLEEPRRITSNKPIAVGQFGRIGGCVNDLNMTVATGGPTFTMLNPIEQADTDIRFHTVQIMASPTQTNVKQTAFLALTAPAGTNDQILLDGQNILGRFKTIGDLAYTTIQIDSGIHRLESSHGVNGYLYTTINDSRSSIGFSIGSALENLNLEILAEDEFLGDVGEENLVCRNAEVSFEAEFDTFPGEEPRFNTFVWDFGDGNFGDGRLVTHKYADADTFLVSLTASDGLGDCSTEEIQTRQVIVLDTEVDDIVGPMSVCPGVEGVSYSVSGAEGNTYQWLVSGGQLVGDGVGEQVLVNWGDSNPDAAVKVVPFNELGCQGDTLVLPVVVDLALQPALPQQADGQPFVCFNEREEVGYFTPFTAGSIYQWFVEGGQILGADDSHQVNVQWFDPGVGKIWYREFNPSISDCEGVSDTLLVDVQPPIELVADIQPVACFGEENGEIVLDIVNRDADLVEVVWEHGPLGLALSGLAAGDYTARITDDLGCELVQTFSVTEPALLAIDDVGVLDVRCFQETNGSAAVVVRGGTEPYRFVWNGPNGFQRESTSPFLERLAPGDYAVQVVDANDCVVTSDFVIDSPDLLEPDLEALINNPVCPEATDGTAFVDAKGGTPAYQFFWSNKPDLNSREGTDLSNGTYTVRIVDANGCETSLEVEVTERVPRVFLPNAFSPNGDGVNDIFLPVADCDLQFSMQIVNRWGNLVFSSEDIEKGWDGMFEGEPAEAGAYTYIVFYSGLINDVRFEETFRGKVALFR